VGKKKKLPESLPERCALIEPEHPDLSVRRQCELLGVNRSTLYYVPATESPLNLELMQLIDKQYMRTPFYGWPRMTVYVRKQGYLVNHKRIQRLMQKMGIQAIYPKPSLSKGHPGHKIYPYLLRDVAITRQNQVWSTDITYIPLRNGFMYLVAVIDWYSRYVLAWQLSNTLESTFCIEVLQQALQQGCPEIFNTDRAPGGAFKSSRGKPLFHAEKGSVQRLTQSPKVQWGQSVTSNGETCAPSSRWALQGKLDKVKAELPEPQNRTGQVEPGGNDGDTHSLLDSRTVGRGLLSPPKRRILTYQGQRFEQGT